MPEKIDIHMDEPEEGKKQSAKSERDQGKIDSALDMLARDLGIKLQEYVGKRYDKEREWLEAEQLYRGIIKTLDDKKMEALSISKGRELPIVNITRPKTNIAIARLQDIQFPTGGDFNFCIEPTPVPEMGMLATDKTPLPPEMQPPQPPAPQPDPNLPPEAQTTPQPPAPRTIGDSIQDIMREAKDKAKLMEQQLHDRMVEADWGRKSRQAMEQMGILGTAVLKAPVLQYKLKKTYNEDKTSEGESIHLMEKQWEEVPTVQWVDIRKLFPQPSARPGSTIEDIFELHLLTKKEVRDLTNNPAFMKDQIRKVLREEPNAGYVAKTHLLQLTGSETDTMEDRYSVMEYHGPLDKEVAFELELISEEDKEDPLVIVQGEVWFVNDRLIRMSVAPLEGDEDIPYLFCTWEDDINHIYGHGIPYLMRHAQRVIASSWIMLLDNAGLTAGPQVVLNKEMIKPANPAEGWSIKPMKVWFMTEYGSNVNEAMQFVNVPTQQESIAAIIEMAMQFADIESSIPAILGGEMPTANNTTFGGMAVVMSNSHILQQRHSERWDDNITVPAVERFYHYEMQYGENPAVKGDYEVKTGGATERIDKQIKSQDLERIMGMAGQTPEFMEQLDIGEAFREWVATTRITGILKSRDAIEAERAEAAQNPQPDPALIEAQVKERQVAVEEQKLAIAQQEMDLKAQTTEANVDRANREIIVRQEENMVRLQEAQMQREDNLMKMAHANQISMAEQANRMQVAVMGEETKRLMKKADLDMFDTEIRLAKGPKGEGI